MKILVEEIRNRSRNRSLRLGNHDPRASIPGEIVPHREFYELRREISRGRHAAPDSREPLRPSWISENRRSLRGFAESGAACLPRDISRRNRKIRGAGRFRLDGCSWIVIAEDGDFDFASGYGFPRREFSSRTSQARFSAGASSSCEWTLVMPTEEPSVAGFNKTG